VTLGTTGAAFMLVALFFEEVIFDTVDEFEDVRLLLILGLEVTAVKEVA